MKLDKAIEINTYLANRLAHISQADEQAAVRLGNEALKRLKEHREEHMDITFCALPGETE